MSISLDAYAALESYAQKRGVTMASVVDAAVREHCGALDTREKRLVPEWCGVVVLSSPNGTGG